MDEEKLNVKFKLIEPGTSKLLLIKAIKSVSSLGLKDAKDFVDSTDQRYQRQFSNSVKVGLMEFSLTKNELIAFENKLKECVGVIFELNGFSKLRNRKLIELGLYDDKDELVNELVEDDLFKVMKGDIEYIRVLLTDRYKQLPEEYIKEKLK